MSVGGGATAEGSPWLKAAPLHVSGAASPAKCAAGRAPRGRSCQELSVGTRQHLGADRTKPCSIYSDLAPSELCFSADVEVADASPPGSVLETTSEKELVVETEPLLSS